MRRRLYFILPDAASARRIRDELLLAWVENAHIHSQYPETASLGIEPTIPAFP